jgi:hypothetical protein
VVWQLADLEHQSDSLFTQSKGEARVVSLWHTLKIPPVVASRKWRPHFLIRLAPHPFELCKAEVDLLP